MTILKSMNFKDLSFIIISLSLITITLCQKSHAGFQLHQNQNKQQTLSIKNNKKIKHMNQKQQFQLKGFLDSIIQIYRQIQVFFTDIFDYLILRKTKQLQKESVIYRQNFASQTGGAQILMVSSSKISSPRAILRNDPDAYLFTADVLPITIVIGLQQQILIDSFAIQSGQVYSCITQDFTLQGAFSLQNQQWIHLGNFTADDIFQTQQFAVEQRIIRYLRLTITSSYGKWKYFTLSQIKVYGQGLFSHAMENLLQSEYNIRSNQTSSDNTHNNSKQKNQQHSTKKLFAEAFHKIAVHESQNSHEQNSNSSNENDSTLKQSLPKDTFPQNQQQQNTQKLNPKNKKTISNLKKKITYLQKRNFQIYNELKQLRKQTQFRINQLQSRNVYKQNHQIVGAGILQWFTYKVMMGLALMVNFFCIGIVIYVLKFKVNEQFIMGKSKIKQQDKTNNKPKQPQQTIRNNLNTEQQQQKKKNETQIVQNLFKSLLKPQKQQANLIKNQQMQSKQQKINKYKNN